MSSSMTSSEMRNEALSMGWLLEMASILVEDCKRLLDEESQLPMPPTVPFDDTELMPDMLTVREAADFLRLNVKTVRDMFHDGQLRGGQRHSVIRISRQSVVDWSNGVRLQKRSAS